MRKYWILAGALTVGMLVASPPEGVYSGDKPPGKGGGGGSGSNGLLPVKVEIVSGSTHLQDDGNGAYYHGENGVNAFLVARGDGTNASLVFNFKSTKNKRQQGNTRCLNVSWGARIDGGGSNTLGVPEEVGCTDANFGVNPDVESGEIGFFDIPLGDSIIARMKVNFGAVSPVSMNEELYTMRLNPEQYFDSYYAEVTFVSGATNGDDTAVQSCTSECPVWRIASDSYTPVATLVSDNANDEGDYQFDFVMEVTLLPN